MAASPHSFTSTPPSSDDFEASARTLGAAPHDKDWWQFDRQGRRFKMRWKPAHKSTPPKVEIITPAGPLGQPQDDTGVTTTAAATEMGPFRGAPRPRIKSPAPLTLRLETGVDRAGKSLRINRETQTGDAVFDERVYLESEATDAVVLAALADPGLRESVLRCLDLGATSVTLDEEGDLHVERPLPHEELIGPEQLTPLLDALGAAAEAIPPLVAVRRGRTFSDRLVLVSVLSAFGSVPLFYLCNWLWEPLIADLYSSAALLGFVLWLVSLPILFFVLRGRSVSLRDLVICTLALAFALPLGCTDLLLTLNGLLDTSKPAVHEATVIHRRATSGKNTTYYVTVPSWHPGEKTIEMSVGSSLYPALTDGAALTVTTAEGALGWERLLHLTPVTAPQTSN